MRIKRPSCDDLNQAAEWLDCNEGDDGEADTCQRVADWLRSQATAVYERAAARENNIPVDRLRKAVARREAVQ